ncbi:NAD(P)-dependent oxidoreductase [Nocardioides plantarum]|uniref:NAD(P)-dependent oxidoreductase n=1 Tax=Nocardioides plantarum TaxID=29299 RepID=A0ABV5KFR5_9ACTN|nr:NAD(P)-dependent oxidoreductase [Nocardioides plantarum]
MRVAFLGLGRMGRPMAVNLVTAGHEVVVWNRTTAVADAFAAEHPAATVVSSPAEAVRDVEVVVTMLADDAALVATYDGDDGVLAGLAARPDGCGVVAVDMSTVSPPTVTDLAARLRTAGHTLVDAPVSGSVPAATDATLTIMAAGDTDAVERALPVLEALGSTVVRVGGSGAGTAMKLALNSVLHGLNAGISEALVLAERAGVERTAAYDVLLSSVVAAPYVGYKRAAFEDPDAAPAAFLLRLAAKDLRLALELADRVGATLPQARTNLAGVEQATAAGYGERDMSALAAYLRTVPTTSTDTPQETHP